MEVGDCVYLEDGTECRLAAIMPKAYCVEPLYRYDECGEPDYGDPVIVYKVFENPPEVIINKQIENKKQELQNLVEEVNKYKDQFRIYEEAEKKMSAFKDKYLALNRICDFLDGKLTHYVKVLYTNKITITTPKEETCSSGDSSGYGSEKVYDTKLLTLFGKSNGDLSWRLNQYKDGSGCSYEVYPCSSYEEALELATQKIMTLLENYYKECLENKNRNIPSDIIKSAEKLNIKIPDKILEFIEEHRKNNIRNNISKLSEELNRLKEKL